MRRTLSHALALFLAISLGVLWNHGVVSAATLTIWPDQLEIDNFQDTGLVTYQNPDTLNGDAHYYYVLRIPAGNRVKFIRVNYNNPASSGFGFDVYLKRKTPATMAEMLINFSSYPPDGTGSVQSDGGNVTGPLLIERGYRYYIEYLPGREGSINSIQVVY